MEFQRSAKGVLVKYHHCWDWSDYYKGAPLLTKLQSKILVPVEIVLIRMLINSTN